MKSPIIFTDFHHASLLQSLILLFEKRLEGSVYRPIGTDWFTQGYWKVYDHPATVEQYLGVGGATPDGTQKLNEVVSIDGDPFDTKTPQIYTCHDIDSGTVNKAVTLTGFFKLPVDIVIASLPQHIEPFTRLCELHPNKPKLIYQIGNQWNVGENIVKNVMASAIIDKVPEGVNFLSYHQEFDTRVFSPFSRIVAEDNELLWPDKVIASYVNVFNGQSHFAEDWFLFQVVEKQLTDWIFKSYGGQCRDGAIGPSQNLARSMGNARFIWHTKYGGDGYGHVIHNAAAVGRPLIVKRQYYQGKLAESLLIDDLTCISIDNLSVNEIVNKIQYFSEPERYKAMCRAVYDNFVTVCNFDEEFVKIRSFLENLL
jgi:hypothetical protein